MYTYNTEEPLTETKFLGMASLVEIDNPHVQIQIKPRMVIRRAGGGKWSKSLTSIHES